LIERKKELANEQITRLYQKKEQLLRRLPSSNIETEQNGVHFSLVSQRIAAITSKSAAAIRRATKTVNFVGSMKDVNRFVSSNAELLEEVTRKGINVQIITEEHNGDEPVPRVVEQYSSPSAPIAIMSIPKVSNRYLLVDDREAIILNASNGNGRSSDGYALWTNSEGMVSILRNDFKRIWDVPVGPRSLNIPSRSKRTDL
jgi:sugar-specific transcriptional regulator TrmB